MNFIYLAGGCFWGLEKLMSSLPGVTETVCGYANGNSEKDAVYEKVCGGGTGFREAVKVGYKPEKISLEAILFAFFAAIDPTVKNRQGNDVGSQYQTGIYYTDGESKKTALRIAETEQKRHGRFEVEIGPLSCFYEAEEYHQRYLDKNPRGYCHIPRGEIERISRMAFDPAPYSEIDERRIGTLTDIQYKVTQKAATEPPFQNEFNGNYEKGIYVDIVTGEPLFTSRDKYESACGWPSFSSVIDENAVVKLPDNSHFMRRIEVRSRAGNSHLGHVFYGDKSSPNGTRYCINSAALRFIPYEDMEREGYKELKEYV